MNKLRTAIIIALFGMSPLKTLAYEVNVPAPDNGESPQNVNDPISDGTIWETPWLKNNDNDSNNLDIIHSVCSHAICLNSMDLISPPNKIENGKTTQWIWTMPPRLIGDTIYLPPGHPMTPILDSLNNPRWQSYPWEVMSKKAKPCINDLCSIVPGNPSGAGKVNFSNGYSAAAKKAKAEKEKAKAKAEKEKEREKEREKEKAEKEAAKAEKEKAKAKAEKVNSGSKKTTTEETQEEFSKTADGTITYKRKTTITTTTDTPDKKGGLVRRIVNLTTFGAIGTGLGMWVNGVKMIDRYDTSDTNNADNKLSSDSHNNVEKTNGKSGKDDNNNTVSGDESNQLEFSPNSLQLSGNFIDISISSFSELDNILTNHSESPWQHLSTSIANGNISDLIHGGSTFDWLNTYGYDRNNFIIEALSGSANHNNGFVLNGQQDALLHVLNGHHDPLNLTLEQLSMFSNLSVGDVLSDPFIGSKLSFLPAIFIYSEERIKEMLNAHDNEESKISLLNNLLSQNLAWYVKHKEIKETSFFDFINDPGISSSFKNSTLITFTDEKVVEYVYMTHEVTNKEDPIDAFGTFDNTDNTYTTWVTDNNDATDHTSTNSNGSLTGTLDDGSSSNSGHEVAKPVDESSTPVGTCHNTCR